VDARCRDGDAELVVLDLFGDTDNHFLGSWFDGSAAVIAEFGFGTGPDARGLLESRSRLARIPGFPRVSVPTGESASAAAAAVMATRE
jgi:hypothetical protein